MNGLDFFIIAVLAIGAIYGLTRGALRMITSVVSLVAAIYFASIYYPRVATIAQNQLSAGPTMAAALGFALVFAAVFLAIEVAGNFLGGIISAVNLGFVDRLGGGALGLTVSCAVMGFALMLLTAVLPSSADLLRGSQLAPDVLRFNEVLIGYIPPVVTDAYRSKRELLWRYWAEKALAAPQASPRPTAFNPAPAARRPATGGAWDLEGC